MGEDKRTTDRSVSRVRESDIEPYTALRWVGTLFKAAAVFLAVALIGEFIAGMRMAGTSALPTLLGELANTAVLAVVLWGGGDLVKLLIRLGNDVRAERILLARLVHRTPGGMPGLAEQEEDEAVVEELARDRVEPRSARSA
jgi:hypothetical protein